MRLGRYNVFIQDMNIIESNIKQWIGFVNFYIKILVQKVIEMIFFRLIVRRINVYINGVLSGIIFGINFVNDFDRIPTDQWFELGEGNNMCHIILISNLK